MTAIDQLKAEHPDFCFVCGSFFDFGYGAHTEHTCDPNPVIAALVAKMEQLERNGADKDLGDWIIECNSLRAQLAEAAKPCEWPTPDGEWEGETVCSPCGWVGFWEGDEPSFCPGCGHPVMVKPVGDAEKEG